MKKLLIPVLSVSFMMAAHSADAQTKTTTVKKTTVKTTTTKTTDTAGHKAVAAKPHVVKKHHSKHHYHHGGKVRASEQEETIMLDNSDEKTVVEIQKGGVYVNGDLISTIKDAQKENHKIIINVKERKEDNDGMGMGGEMEAPKHKALLGVFTADNNMGDGAQIRSVIHNSPADKAGLESGDVITRVGGMDVKSSTDLVTAIGDHEQGETVAITYTRNGSEAVTNASLDEVPTTVMPEHGEREEADEMLLHDLLMPPPPPHMGGYEEHYNNNDPYTYHIKIGIVAENTPDMRGVVVRGVKPNSPAQSAGIKEGDIIVSLDHKRIHSVEDIHMVMSYAWPNERMKVVVKRDGEHIATRMILSRRTFKRSF